MHEFDSPISIAQSPGKRRPKRKSPLWIANQKRYFMVELIKTLKSFYFYLKFKKDINLAIIILIRFNELDKYIDKSEFENMNIYWKQCQILLFLGNANLELSKILILYLRICPIVLHILSKVLRYCALKMYNALVG